jgi:dTDP-4-dehydrorhamnose reductase
VTSRQELDICRPETALAIIRASKPWAIINTAGFVRVGEAEREKSRCILENTEGPAILAEVAAREGIPLVTFSSDLVFDGLARRPYVESDPTSPSCVYGASKAEAERRVVAINRRAMVVRASAFFGPWDRYNFVYSVLAALRRGETFSAASDVVVSPTYVPDLVHAVLDLLIDGADGVWHLAGSEILSWREMAQRVAGAAQLDPGLIRELSSGAARNTALRSEKGVVLPSGADAIERCAIALAALEP